jgi:hypothetical protein
MGWPWSKKEAAPPPLETVTNTDPERYVGKPMLRLLELYVLWSVDHLSENDASRLQAMAPKLTGTFAATGLGRMQSPLRWNCPKKCQN